MATRKRRRKSRAKLLSGLPKGAYRLPNGNIMTPPTVGPPDKRGRRIVMRGELRAEPDLDKLVKALIEVARQQVLGDEAAPDDEGVDDHRAA
jgi:hypothetical protein